MLLTCFLFIDAESRLSVDGVICKQFNFHPAKARQSVFLGFVSLDCLHALFLLFVFIVWKVNVMDFAYSGNFVQALVSVTELPFLVKYFVWRSDFLMRTIISVLLEFQFFNCYNSLIPHLLYLSPTYCLKVLSCGPIKWQVDLFI